VSRLRFADTTLSSLTARARSRKISVAPVIVSTTKQNGGEKSIEDYQLKESVQVKNTGRYKEGA
jgi:hypothetical protein